MKFFKVFSISLLLSCLTYPTKGYSTGDEKELTNEEVAISENLEEETGNNASSNPSPSIDEVLFEIANDPGASFGGYR